MESMNYLGVILLVLTQCIEPVQSQGPTNNSIAAAISDAAREVSARRSGGLVQAQRAASGNNIYDRIENKFSNRLSLYFS